VGNSRQAQVEHVDVEGTDPPLFDRGALVTSCLSARSAARLGDELN
jgi:hypothetical protein